MPVSYVFDFDSTISKEEALEEFANMILENHSQREEIIKEIEYITNLGIDKKITFTESLKRRLSLFNARKEDIQRFLDNKRLSLSQSVMENVEFFHENKDNIYIISGGFHEFIQPLIKPLQLKEENIYANNFVFDGEKIVGFDELNIASTNTGKQEQLKQLNLPGKIVVIGDGTSDKRMKEEGGGHIFCAYTENVRREETLKGADFELENIHQLLDIVRKEIVPLIHMDKELVA